MSSTAPDPTNAAPDAPAPANVPHQAIYRRWRAQTFAEIVGQAAVVETLRNAVRAGRVSHAILFVGPRGTGKTSLARILAKAVNCTNLQDGDPCDRCEACVSIREGRAIDLVEIDAASNRGINDIRELRDRIHYAPIDLRRKVYILDEAHQITKDAWNALLKSLEEPPDFVIFIFASTHPQEFPPAILSRLQRYDVRRLTVDEIQGKLDRILADESVTAEPAAVRLIARLAAGGMRDAESMLDQVLASAGGSIDESSVRDLLGLAEAEAVTGLATALVDGQAAAGIAILDAIDERGRDVAVVLDQVVDELRVRLTEALDVGDDPRAARLAAAARRLAAIDPERRGVGGLRFQLELALLDAATRAPAVPVMLIPAPSAPAPSARADQVPAEPIAKPKPARSTTLVEPAAAGPSATGRAAAELAAAEPAAAEPVAAERAALEPAAPKDGVAPEPAPVDIAPVVPATAEPDPAPTAGRTPAPARSTSTGEDGIDRLRAVWPEVVAVLSQSPPVKPLIAACRPVSVDGPIVTLGFPEDQAFLKDALERRRSMLEDGIGRVLGHAVNVRCVATNLEHVPDVQTGPSSDLISEARRIFAEDLVDIGEVS
ncbi:MAG TPA: DNA polymerase III subunit gamma/tau [Candidatus Limnocylindrales bacterium]